MKKVQDKVDQILEDLIPLIKICNDQKAFDVEAALRKGFEYLSAAASHIQFRYEEQPKLIRRLL